MKIGYIDRFEADLAVIEVDGTAMNIPLERLPGHARPGDAVRIEGDRISVDADMTERRKREIQELMDSVWEE